MSQSSFRSSKTSHVKPMFGAIFLVFLSAGIFILDFKIGTFEPTSTDDYVDIASEGLVALMVGIWVLLILRARLERAVEILLSLGFVLIYIGFFQDCITEFIEISDTAIKNWAEDLPTPIGALFVSIGFLRWSNQQIQLYRASEEEKFKLEMESLTDELTQTGNSRALVRTFKNSIQEANTKGFSFVIAIFDLDHFKKINDTYGHSAGDDVLRYFGKLLQTGSRHVDLPFRYGGEEFILLMPDTTNLEATQAVQRILSHFNSKAFHFSGFPETVFCSASAGIATLLENDTPDTLFKRADSALYLAKTNGRNRVVNYDEKPAV